MPDKELALRTIRETIVYVMEYHLDSDDEAYAYLLSTVGRINNALGEEEKLYSTLVEELKA
jgi:hypothetical protein